MNPKFFKTQDDFRRWLEKHHATESEVTVGYYKVASGKPSLTWSESVDQALCFGWIDGIRHSLDDESYCIRFTPRKSTSNWSVVNIRKIEKLTKAGLMHEAGLKAYSLRTTKKSEIYSYENMPKELGSKFATQFKKNKKAWEFYTNQPPYYKKKMNYWVMSAKQEKTRFSRLEKLINASKEEKRLG